MKIIQDFKKFILRGNALDLAIGVVIGAAFSGLVQSLVKDIITPFIAAIWDQPDFSSLAFSINGSQFMYGNFLNALISLVIVAFAVFFFIVRPMNKFLARFGPQPADPPKTKKCPQCLSDIPDEAKRCSHCTQLLD